MGGGDQLKPIVKGFAEGFAYVILNVENEKIDTGIQETIETDAEMIKFESALNKVTEKLKDMIDVAENRSDQVTAEILSVHVMLLGDEALIEEIQTSIQEKRTASGAVKHVFDSWITTFQAMDNAYMRERSTDLKDLKQGLIQELTQQNNKIGDHNSTGKNMNILQENVILFTDELTPSQLATMNIDKLKGIVTRKGGETSHAAIMCKSLGIPMLVGNYEDAIGLGTPVKMDAVEGELYLNADEDISKRFSDMKYTYESFQSKLGDFDLKPKIKGKLHNNLGDLDNLENVVTSSATGIGLFRTEFLFMKSATIPTEEEQFIAYKRVLEQMKPNVVTIRTIDIGGDKELPYLDMPKEDNPFLGYRAIRMCLGTHESVFRNQLRAILRASQFGNAKIMFPMISNTSEWLQAKKILEEEKNKLESEAIAFNKGIQVGIMIEVPSAAICSKVLASHVDFFSIGTNDLTQYTMAADRMNNDVAYLYSYFEPAVLSLIKMTIDAANQAGIEVSVCGEMASNPLAIPLLKSMGLNKYSVSPSRTDATGYVLSELYTNPTSLMSHSEKNILDFELSRKDIIGELQGYMEHVFKEDLQWL